MASLFDLPAMEETKYRVLQQEYGLQELLLHFADYQKEDVMEEDNRMYLKKDT